MAPFNNCTCNFPSRHDLNYQKIDALFGMDPRKLYVAIKQPYLVQWKGEDHQNLVYSQILLLVAMSSTIHLKTMRTRIFIYVAIGRCVVLSVNIDFGRECTYSIALHALIYFEILKLW